MRLCAVVFVALFSACDSPSETDDRPCRLAERAVCEHLDECGQTTGFADCMRSFAEANDGQGWFCTDTSLNWEACPPAVETYECQANSTLVDIRCIEAAER